MSRDTIALMRREIGLINRMFQQNSIRAKASTKQTACIETGYISYGLSMAMDEKFQRVEGIQRELSNLLTNGRQRLGIAGNVQVIPVATPRLALEVPHPSPLPLQWSPRKVTTTPVHSMLIGRSYVNGPKNEYISFDDAPHTLIAGITGAGKSVLLQTMLLSLCAGTSPDDLRLVLVDLKNEDLVPFECLPHVQTFAGTREAALEAIESVVVEKDRRVKRRGYKPYRLVLVIDEMAQLANDKMAREMLGDLASIGRSKAINLIGATQSPTKAGGLGSLLKANFPVRLVGMVAPGQSYVATGRPQTHADLLPGKGAFLRCEGPDLYRFQSYFIGAGEVEGMAKFIAKDIWQSVRTPEPATGRGKVEAVTQIGGKTLRTFSEPIEPVLGAAAGSLVVEPHRTGVEPVPEPVQNRSEPFVEPLEDKRSLTAKEALCVQELYQTGLSKTALCKRVYGSKNGQYMEWINQALDAVDDGKVIRLRKTG